MPVETGHVCIIYYTTIKLTEILNLVSFIINFVCALSKMVFVNNRNFYSKCAQILFVSELSCYFVLGLKQTNIYCCLLI